MKTLDNSSDTQHIYRQLKLGLGHELVNDGNVFALMAIAHADGNTLLETELREWQAPCSDSDDGPRPTMRPGPASRSSSARRRCSTRPTSSTELEPGRSAGSKPLSPRAAARRKPLASQRLRA